MIENAVQVFQELCHLKYHPEKTDDLVISAIDIAVTKNSAEFVKKILQLCPKEYHEFMLSGTALMCSPPLMVAIYYQS